LLDCGVTDRVADQADKKIQEERHSSEWRRVVLAGKDFGAFVSMEILT
jgi:hypothetical protein